MQAGGMLGIVLCAGLGTRLRPLTLALPKPAVPVGPVPAALRNIEQLLNAGVQIVHCNTHYLAEDLEHELKAACRSRNIPESAVRFWNEPDILETGGGIVRIAHSWASETGLYQDALVVSGDIVADIPVGQMLSAWSRRTSNQTSLMVSLPLDKPRKDVTWVDETKGTIHGFGADAEPESAAKLGLTARVFSNHQIISAQILHRCKVEKKSSIDLFYRSAIARSEEIIHVPLESDALWFDIGTPETYLTCMNKLGHYLPPELHHLRLSMLNLCLPSQPSLETTDNDQIMHDPDYSRTEEIAHEQSCLSTIAQKYSWTWLGQVHSVPHFFRDGLSGILNCIDGQRSRSSALSAETSPSLHITPSAGDFLFKSESAVLPIHRVGFIQAPLPLSLSTHPLLHQPLLVPLDLVAAFNASEPFVLSKNTSPFWILFTRPLP
jgi:choline kinase